MSTNAFSAGARRTPGNNNVRGVQSERPTFFSDAVLDLVAAILGLETTSENHTKFWFLDKLDSSNMTVVKLIDESPEVYSGSYDGMYQTPIFTPPAHAALMAAAGTVLHMRDTADGGLYVSVVRRGLPINDTVCFPVNTIAHELKRFASGVPLTVTTTKGRPMTITYAGKKDEPPTFYPAFDDCPPVVVYKYGGEVYISTQYRPNAMLSKSPTSDRLLLETWVYLGLPPPDTLFPTVEAGQSVNDAFQKALASVDASVRNFENGFGYAHVFKLVRDAELATTQVPVGAGYAMFMYTMDTVHDDIILSPESNPLVTIPSRLLSPVNHHAAFDAPATTGPVQSDNEKAHAFSKAVEHYESVLKDYNGTPDGVERDMLEGVLEDAACAVTETMAAVEGNGNTCYMRTDEARCIGFDSYPLPTPPTERMYPFGCKGNLNQVAQNVMDGQYEFDPNSVCYKWPGMSLKDACAYVAGGFFALSDDHMRRDDAPRDERDANLLDTCHYPTSFGEPVFVPAYVNGDRTRITMIRITSPSTVLKTVVAGKHDKTSARLKELTALVSAEYTRVPNTVTTLAHPCVSCMFTSGTYENYARDRPAWCNLCSSVVKRYSTSLSEELLCDPRDIAALCSSDSFLRYVRDHLADYFTTPPTSARLLTPGFLFTMMPTRAELPTAEDASLAGCNPVSLEVFACIMYASVSSFSRQRVILDSIRPMLFGSM